MPSIAGKTFVANFIDTTLDINFWLSAGTSNAARAGIGQQVGTIEITKVRMEPDALGPPVHRTEQQGVELERCRRYFQIQGFRGAGRANAANEVYSILAPLSTMMRTTPTFAVSMSGQINVAVAESGSLTGLAHLNATAAATGNWSAVGTVACSAEYPDTAL